MAPAKPKAKSTSSSANAKKPKDAKIEKPSAAAKAPHTKLPRLDESQKVKKRPLNHPPIAGPRTNASNPKIVYISSSTPFISAVKRVRNLLSEVTARSEAASRPNFSNPNSILSSVSAGIKNESIRHEEVTMKATGKTVERLLHLCVHFQGQDDVVVRVWTGTVGAVDDIFDANDDGEGAGLGEESRPRKMGCLCVGVRLK